MESRVLLCSHHTGQNITASRASRILTDEQTMPHLFAEITSTHAFVRTTQELLSLGAVCSEEPMRPAVYLMHTQ